MWKSCAHFIVIVMVAGTGNVEDVSSHFKVTMKRENDRVEIKAQGDRTVFSIKSPFGISHAVIERTGEMWPALIVLRLHLRGLENFRVSNGTVTLEGAASSQDGNQRLGLRTAENQEIPVDSESKYWMEVRMLGSDGQPSNVAPLKDGYFEMNLPKSFFDGNPKSITVNWIDFYR